MFKRGFITVVRVLLKMRLLLIKLSLRISIKSLIPKNSSSSLIISLNMRINLKKFLLQQTSFSLLQNTIMFLSIPSEKTALFT